MHSVETMLALAFGCGGARQPAAHQPLKSMLQACRIDNGHLGAMASIVFSDV
jgi:hypothetical protein